MKRERILVVALIVTAVFTLLLTSLVTADTLSNNHNSDQSPTKDESSQTALGGGQAIIITKTVGLDPGTCATTKTVLTAPGTTATYCYQIANTGNVNLTLHDLEDSELGIILNDFPFTLIPGSSAFLTQSAVIDIATINTATWTASNPGPTNTVTYIDAATVIANNLSTCRFPALPIPDNNITGTSTLMNLNSIGTIADLDIYLEVSHTWVGDLRFMLEHIDTGTAVELVNRPGAPPSTFGCGSNDMRAIIDDEANTAVETSCGPGNLALAGRYVGGDPANNSLLAAFDGEDLSGEWQLSVSDNASGDAGTLNAWCLLPTLLAPEITVTPDTLTATQPPNAQTGQILNLYNSGNTDLQWMVHESRETPIILRPALPMAMPVLNSGEASVAADTATDKALLGERSMVQPFQQSPTAAPPVNVLYDNGPLGNLPGAGAGGADASVLQISLGLGSFGFAHQAQGGNTVADDFTVTHADGWYVNSIDFFAYQTGSTLSSTITAVNYRIWDGPPNDPGSNILINPTLSNQLLNTAWSGIYRVAETTITVTDRPIMQNTTSGGFVLPPGTYWLEWQTDGSLASGPWAPPVTISNVITTGNALQNFGNVWSPVQNGGNAQGLPFVISGHPLDDIPWASVDPVSGTLPSGTTDVIVIFDSAGLAFGIYTGTLLVASNDPVTPLISVPLTLTVGLSEIYLPFILKP